MRQAMANADVGDDVLDGDPTVSRLEARVAELLGKEAGLFFPTGSMANMTGLAVHAALGSEALLDEDAHIIHGEMAGAAGLLGVQVRLVRVGKGRTVMNADDLRRAIRAPSKHDPAISVICLENTHNGAGGKVTTLGDMRAMREVAREHGIPVHMDGARLWNASAATGTSLADFGSTADTVMLSFSKALGCPVGAILVGDAPAMKRAHAVRKRFGGGMRQSEHPCSHADDLRARRESRAAARGSRECSPFCGCCDGSQRRVGSAAGFQHRDDRPRRRRFECERGGARGAGWCPHQRVEPDACAGGRPSRRGCSGHVARGGCRACGDRGMHVRSGAMSCLRCAACLNSTCPRSRRAAAF